MEKAKLELVNWKKFKGRPVVTRVSKKALESIAKIDPSAIVKGKGVDYRKLQVRKMDVTAGLKDSIWVSEW